jgi:hypothetical protein
MILPNTHEIFSVHHPKDPIFVLSIASSLLLFGFFSFSFFLFGGKQLDP